MDSMERAPAATKIPEVYKLQEAGAQVGEVVRQMYEDAHSTKGANEKIFIGIRSLLARGQDGVEALAMLGKGSDELARIAQTVASQPDLSDQDLETALGISRLPETIDMSTMDPQKLFYTIYSYCFRKGYTSNSYQEFNDELRIQFSDESRGAIPQLEGTVDNYLLSNAATFGSSEPTYMELVGTMEILRLRAMKSPQFLLLGSLGAYSSREFAQYARKINSGTLTHTIELSPRHISLINKDRADDADRFLVQADARMLPYADGSMDHVYTNHLFHSLREYGTRREGTSMDVLAVIDEASRVLKRGGSLVIDEQRFGVYGRIHRGEHSPAVMEHMQEEVREMMRIAGFEEVANIPGSYTFAISKDRATAKINENGFPQYGDTLFLKGSSDALSMRFVKK